jgi:hypothetical protein
MKFKTPSQLKITREEFDALVVVLDKLEHLRIPAKLFTMETVGFHDLCGTPACIKGWGNKVLKRRAFDYESNHPCNRLFYPFQTNKCDPYKAKRKQAAKALRTYLRTGKPNWEKVMAAR